MAAAKNENTLIFQVFLIGDSGVGKSCLLERFAEGTYREQFTPTTGAEFMTWTIPLEEKMIRLQINDVAGRKEYRTATADDFKKAHGFIIVYDVTDQRSFSGVKDWLRELDWLRNKNVMKILVGNKCDMEAEKVITSEMAQELANQWGSKHLETSAKNGTNVAEIFVEIAADIKNRLYPQLNEPCMDAEWLEMSRHQKRISLNRPHSGGGLHIENSSINQPSLPDSPEREPDYIFKIFVLGDELVGKDCLILRFTDDEYPADNSVTIGVDFKRKEFDFDGHRVKLIIWTGGYHERFRKFRGSHYPKSDGFIIVYDVTNKTSFDNINKWLEEIAEYAPGDVIKLLVGNKSDMTEKKAVSHQSAQMFADELRIPVLEASAKTGEGVEEVFKTITALIIKSVGPPGKRNFTNKPGAVIPRKASEKNCRLF
ncbi:uncharacterized protein LOC144149273 [Haemaphysalis longicornis]